MDVETARITVEPPRTLRGLCEAVISKNPAAWPIDESRLAEEFISYFPALHLLLRFEDLVDFAAMLGIGLSEEKLPSPVRGHNHHYGEKREIRISAPESPIATAYGVREHTFFHELRELMEYEFCKLGCPTATGAQLEERAEQFASFVRATVFAKALGPTLDSALQIESKFWRYAAVVGATLFVIVAGLSCIILPRIEDRLPK